VCTVSGAVRRHGVGEFALGTPLRTVVEELGGGALDGRSIVAVMSGAANALLPADLLDTPLTYEAMQAAGSGLGACGFIVWDDTVDPVAIAAGVARFLAVESCGQCRHCKQDGLILADTLRRLAASDVTSADVDEIDARLASVAEGARCNLAGQQETVVGSILRLFPDHVAAHADRRAAAVVPEAIVPIADVVDGRAVLEMRQAEKQPDWSFDAEDSGQWPADRLDDPRRPRAL
jgi:NADH:ubiquinone oxidoreductase subunit F (NADH-binding)